MINEKKRSRLKPFIYVKRAVAIVFTFVFLVCFVIGVSDIYDCHNKANARDLQLKTAVSDHVSEVSTPVIHGKTGWSVFHDIVDLNTETYATWPNNYMAAYYGLEKIYGTE